METQEQIVKAHKRNDHLKTGAQVALIILLLNVVAQLLRVYQTGNQLISPLIPERTIWEINKQFIFHALVAGVAGIPALLLYFFKKYLFVIILVAIILIADRFIYI